MGAKHQCLLLPLPLAFTMWSCSWLVSLSNAHVPATLCLYLLSLTSIMQPASA